jgi:hypothetical protein
MKSLVTDLKIGHYNASRQDWNMRECGKDRVGDPTLSAKTAERMEHPLKAPASESGRYRRTSAPLKNASGAGPKKTSVQETEKYNSRFLSAQPDAFTGSEREEEASACSVRNDSWSLRVTN